LLTQLQPGELNVTITRPCVIGGFGHTIAWGNGDRVGVWRLPETDIAEEITPTAESSVYAAFPGASEANVTANLLVADASFPFMQITGDGMF